MEVVLIFIIFAFTSAWLAKNNKRNQYIWFIVGIIFGPVGLLVYFFPKKEKTDKQPKSNKKDNNISLTIHIDSTNEHKGDSFEGWFYEEVEEYFPSNSKFKIKYRDAKGQETERVIQINKFGEANHGWFFLAYCESREANRSFRSDRILECVDMETGEFVDDLPALLLEKWQSSDEYKEIQERAKKREEREAEAAFIENYINEHSALLKTLLYLVRCDGTFNKLEKAIVKEVLEYVSVDEFPSDKTLEKVYKKIAMPTYKSFQASVRKLIEESRYTINIIDIAENIINTQSTIHVNEEAALKYLKKKA